ncbi:MAG: EamA family transporter, partial [Bacteriovoracaceae bacterium]|nr:EamA family transporter [Bacteriovoracaceae bacterium]
LLTPFMFKYGKGIKGILKSSDIFVMFSVALLGGALGTLSIVKALFLVNFDHLSVVVLLQKLQPVFAIVLARIILKERTSIQFVLYAVIAIIASYFLTFGWSIPSMSENLPLIHAAMWAILAAFCFGSSTVLGRKLVLKYPFPLIHYLRFGMTTLIMTIVVLFAGKFGEVEKVTELNWLIFVLIALSSGSGAVFLFYFGLQKVKASVSTICELFFPITAIVLDYFINNHILSIIQWCAAATMLLAIMRIAFLAQKKNI